MTDQRHVAYAALLLRLALGAMYLSHSLVLKLFVFTLTGNAQFFASIGLPAALGHVVFAAEAIGGVMLILGVQSRWVALALLPILLGAVWVHAPNGWMFGYPNGGWEYPAYLVVLSIVQILLGDGAHALNPSRPLVRGAPSPTLVR
ncbi:MAG TPA: DoxX family protein [Alphaproteobacteria bacterium]|nr:DoxX family protein [Alphaproteobacteria bacterium]